MPPTNQFQHQQYSSEKPHSNYSVIQAQTGPEVESAEWRQRMLTAGNVLQDKNLFAIYLVHGTFVGTDTLGLARTLDRLSTTIAHQFRRSHKRLADLILRERSNYNQSYATLMEKSLGGHIPVRLFHWSGENHHLGRADGAVRLIDDLNKRKIPPGSRVLLWGHSHAGNLFALLSNLLGGDKDARQRFFQAAGPWRSSSETCPASQAWWRVRSLLDHGNPFDPITLNALTFGTPICYGWDTNTMGKLLHFVYHRTPPHLSDTQHPLQQQPVSKLSSYSGDILQQIGISGTNFYPFGATLRDWQANRQLGALFERSLPKQRLLNTLRAGKRVAEDGITLFTDYSSSAKWINRPWIGHSMYTHRRWLLFHIEETIQRLFLDA